MSLAAQEGRLSVLRRISHAVWRALASPAFLVAVSVLLALSAFAIVTFPVLRPGVPQVWEPGAMHAFWGALHSAAGWAMRGLLALLALGSLVRLADGLSPTLPIALTTPMPLATAEADEADALWERLLALLTRSGWALSSVSAGADGRHVVATRSLAHRLGAGSLYLGLGLLVLALSMLWRDGWVSTSPALLLGEAASMPAPISWRVTLDELELFHEPGEDLELAGANLWVADGSGGEDDVRLAIGRVALARGWVISVAQHLPAARIVALDDTGAGLDLYPMVSNRSAGPRHRVAFVRQEEHLLALPEANLLIRSLYVGGDAGTCCIQVQVLDGLQGHLRGEVFLSESTDLPVDGITVRVVPERALILAIWHLPGLGWAALGALALLVGALAHRISPPRRFAVGIVHASEQGRHVLYVAAPPRMARADWFESLHTTLAAELA